MAQELLAIALVLGLLAVAVWALRRRGLARWSVRKGTARRVMVMERVPLTAQHSLHLVRVGERGLLIAAHPAGCTLVDSLAWREIEAQR